MIDNLDEMTGHRWLVIMGRAGGEAGSVGYLRSSRRRDLVFVILHILFVTASTGSLVISGRAEGETWSSLYYIFYSWPRRPAVWLSQVEPEARPGRR